MTKKNFLLNVTSLGLGHLLVDAASISIYTYIISQNTISDKWSTSIALLYLLVAFGFEMILGVLLDRYQIPTKSIYISLLLTTLGLVFLAISPILSFLIVIFGNSLYHISAGTISLNITPKKATPPGLIVAPGAIGVLIGTIVGKTTISNILLLIIPIIATTIFIYYVKHPKINYDKITANITQKEHIIIIAFLFISIIIRALVGTSVKFPWKDTRVLFLFLILAIVLGKGLGGILADRYGWKKIGVGGLLLSIPLLLLGTHVPLLGMGGAFVFNFTMPITLTALYIVLPGRPGFSFGLTTFALMLGALPSYIAPISQNLNLNIFIPIMIIVSAIMIYTSLNLLPENNHEKY